MKAIPGYAGYFATEAGQIVTTHGPRQRLIRPCPISRGYLAFKARVAHRRYVTAYVHRLVALAYHGVPSSPHVEVRHLDGDMRNNQPSNLRWGSRAENAADRVRHGTDASGERNPMARLTPSLVLEIRRARVGGEPGVSVAKRLGVSPMTVSRAARGESWKNVGGAA